MSKRGVRTDTVDSRQLADSERGEHSTESSDASLRLVGSIRILGVSGLRVGLLALMKSVHLRLLDPGIAVCSVRGVELVAVADPPDSFVLLDEIKESQVELSRPVHGRGREGRGRETSQPRASRSFRYCRHSGRTHVSGDTKELLYAELGETLEEELSEINLVVGEVARRRHAAGVVELFVALCGGTEEARTLSLSRCSTASTSVVA